jgi:hypothetical protein
MRILIFSPFQAIEKHSFLETLCTRTLRANGHTVDLLLCSRDLMPYCIAHTAFGLSEIASTEEKEKVCRRCISNKKKNKTHYSHAFEISDFLRPGDEAWIQEQIAKVSRTNFREFKVDEIELGSFACFEFILNHKISDIEAVSEEIFSHFFCI